MIPKRSRITAVIGSWATVTLRPNPVKERTGGLYVARVGGDGPDQGVDPTGQDRVVPSRRNARQAAPTPVRVEGIPGELRRIADLIETAAVLAPLTDMTAAMGLASPSDLQPRQWEIIRRLVDGQRVPSIAAAMFLSRSTIRNHLSAIFAKVGVHSQDELVAMYRRNRLVLTPDDGGVTNRPAAR